MRQPTLGLINLRAVISSPGVEEKVVSQSSRERSAITNNNLRLLTSDKINIIEIAHKKHE